jgi:hypothetical protein
MNGQDWPAWISAIVSVIAFVAVLLEYVRQRRSTRLQLAQQMIERLDDDPMLQFAATSLDWGAGLAVIPTDWRDVVGRPSVEVDVDLIAESVSPVLTKSVAEDPLKLLYRHAFVHLFNHLERIGALLRNGAVVADDLAPMAEMAGQLKWWDYASDANKQCFGAAMDRWYPGGLPQRVIAAVAGNVPLKTASTTLPSHRSPP